MSKFVSPDGTEYEGATDLSPEELKEPLSVIISLKSLIEWSKTAIEAKKITTHMQKNLVNIQRLQEENTTWNEYLNDVVEKFKKLVPEAVLCYQKAPDIPKTETDPEAQGQETP